MASTSYCRSLPIGCTSSTSSSLSLRRNLTSNRVSKRLPPPSRTLWWWSRHGSWSSSTDENLEDKVQNYQKIMRYRYSRALRRRALWDRDNSPPQWALSRPGRWLGRAWGCKPISTSEHMQARLKDEQSGFPRNDRPWEDAHRDFESFKAAVDRAIAKDPVGFLFGRRLQGPLSPNNSSWTSFARIFDSKASQESFEADRTPPHTGKKIKIENLDSKVCNPSPERKSTAQSVARDSEAESKSQSEKNEQYVFDPISGRNIPKPNKSAKSMASRVMDALFQEHGAEPSTNMPRSKSSQKDAKAVSFQSSRSYEYHQLRAATLGSSIETTAEYSGKIEAEPAHASSESAVRDTAVPKEQDDSPPFTGTTYERSHGPASDFSTTQSAWLTREGFNDNDPASEQALSKTEKHSAAQTLQPSFDRMQEMGQKVDKKIVTKLQPAADRIAFSDPRQERQAHCAPLHVARAVDSKTKPPVQPASDELILDTREDIDLLRASDVRAATRMLRATKSEMDQARADARNKLEADFSRRSTEHQEDQTLKPTTHRILSQNPVLRSANVTDQAKESRDENANTTQVMSATSETKNVVDLKFPHNLLSLARNLRDIYMDGTEENSLRQGKDIGLQSDKSQMQHQGSTQVDRLEGKSLATESDADSSQTARNDEQQSSGDRISRRPLASDERQRLVAMRQLNARIKKDPGLLEKQVLQPKRDEAQAPPLFETHFEEEHQRTADTQAVPTSPYVILTYNKKTAEVEATHLNNLMGQPAVATEKANPMVVMGNLNYPAAFVTHFVSLEQAGYSLASGGGDILIFHNAAAASHSTVIPEESVRSIQAIKSDIAELKNKIAEEEARNQPISQPAKTLSRTEDSAATVVEQIPTDPVERITGSDIHTQKKPDKRSRRVRRQEQVFSGTIKPSQKAASSSKADSTTAQASGPRAESTASDQPGFLRNVLQTLRRMTLATVGLGVVAYTIGVISEGMGAHAQSSGGSPNLGGEFGPRKKIVMPVGQRPGIYSTESSRVD